MTEPGNTCRRREAYFLGLASVPKFLGSYLRPNSFWSRAAKFSMVGQECVFRWVNHTPVSRGRDPSVPKILGPLSTAKRFDLKRPNMVWSQPRLRPQRSPKFWVFPWATPRILRWGTKQDSWAERAKRICTPPTFPNVGYKQANISRGLLNILKFAVWFSH